MTGASRQTKTSLPKATLRQYVSFTIVISVVSGVIALNYLYYVGSSIPLDVSSSNNIRKDPKDSTTRGSSQSGQQKLFSLKDTGDSKTLGSLQSGRQKILSHLADFTTRGSSQSGQQVLSQLPPSPDQCQSQAVASSFTAEELGLVDIVAPNVTRGREQPLEKIREIQSRIETLLKSRNPCWRSKYSRYGLACVPYFYLAGFPKCGTSDLSRRLSFHPHIMRSTHKELQWVTRARFRSKYGRLSSLDRYQEYFGHTLIHYWTCETNMSKAVIGDNSASTVWDNRFWREMPVNKNCSQPRAISADVVRHLNRQAKIIVIVRNPTDRLYSEYMFFHSNATKQVFHSEAVTAVTKATECLKRHNIRHCVYGPLNNLTLRIHVGMYNVYIEDWLLRFPRDQFHVVRLEDMAKNAEEVLQKAYEFLGVGAPDEATIVEMVNKPIANVGQKVQEAGPMLNETRALLNEFYRPLNAKLASLLQDTKYEWL